MFDRDTVACVASDGCFVSNGNVCDTSLVIEEEENKRFQRQSKMDVNEEVEANVVIRFYIMATISLCLFLVFVQKESLD